jgi:putative peptidoglycan lipid II flippase
MFERGEFGPDSTALVYQSLLFWALALIPHCALEVVNRIFYAQKDTTTPLLGATLGLLIHAALAGALYQLLAAGGLALTNGIATAGEVLFLLVIAHRQLSGVEAGALLHTLGRTLLAAGLMGGAVLALSAALSGLSPLLLAATGGLLGVLVYIGAGLLLGVEEIRLLPQLVRR